MRPPPEAASSRGCSCGALRRRSASRRPKVGVFYVALLPQFLPSGSNPLAVGLLLAGIHALLSLVWFALLIALASALGRWLRRPGTVRGIDGVTGTTLVGFGLRLALSGR